jgi:hypothetical protein
MGEASIWENRRTVEKSLFSPLKPETDLKNQVYYK